MGHIVYTIILHVNWKWFSHFHYTEDEEGKNEIVSRGAQHVSVVAQYSQETSWLTHFFSSCHLLNCDFWVSFFQNSKLSDSVTSPLSSFSFFFHAVFDARPRMNIKWNNAQRLLWNWQKKKKLNNLLEWKKRKQKASEISLMLSTCDSFAVHTWTAIMNEEMGVSAPGVKCSEINQRVFYFGISEKRVFCRK